ncbi:unnamed protein product [Thlaspi arvense]|uniref:Major facilitator superfamily (MFS) profile domain-containing protein n=1 Tax=Thlaspi arvense TaxID=13288 RepID=A0AAU9RQ40_THLAR|nr:unnamed protein product [Thlaspi arvense]
MMVVKEETSIEEGLLQLKNQNDDSSCRITACVILSTFVAVCGSFSFGVAIGYTSGAEVGIMKDMGLSIAQFSAFGSFSTLGATIGALFSGKMAIILGRRGTMWVSDILCITGWLSIAFAKDVMWLNFGRISSGIGIGLISYVVPVYIAEITPKHVRGTFTFSNQAKVATEKELENSLLRLRGRRANISRESSEIQVMTRMIENDSKSSFSDLFQKKYRHTLVVGVGLMLIQQFSGSSAVMYYASTIFRKAGKIKIPKAMIGLILVDRWGRRPLLLTSAFGMGITCMLLGIAFALQKMQLLTELTPVLTFICVTLYIAAYAIGLGGLPWVIMSEIFPMNIKVTAGTLVTLASWSSSSIVTYAFNFLFEWSTQGTFYIFGAIGGAALIFIWLLVPETKGLSLEEIQASLIRQPDEINYI